MLNIVENYFVLFLIYSVAGWLTEVVGGFIQFRKLSNRGFLVGPVCPVYGVGVVFLSLLLSRIADNIILTFLLGIIICGTLEYFTSYTMEKLFNARWWDYSSKKFNLNGRICLETLILFGIAAVITLKYTNPFIIEIANKIPDLYRNIGFFVLLLILGIDCIVSFNVILSFRNTTRELKDNTDEISNLVREVLSKKSFLSKRLVDAFPNFKVLTKKIKDTIEEKIETGAEFIEIQKIRSARFIALQKLKGKRFIVSKKNKGKEFITLQKNKGVKFIVDQKNKIVRLKKRKEE